MHQHLADKNLVDIKQYFDLLYESKQVGYISLVLMRSLTFKK